MSSSKANLEKYRIPLEEIIRATNNFGFDTLIGDGGFGVVHKGQLSKQWQNRIVAIKHLNQNGYQGNGEFRNELEMVSSFHHPNIIPFIGYCDDDNEMILVYEYAVNGGLDRHLQNPNKRRCMTWAQRLNICLGVARGLKYLHSGLGEHMRVIHRDVKSANILLDENLDAKICDFGLSRFGPRNQPDSELLTKASGTRFYIDPIYNERGKLWKESDVYSFGVVLFEMSSGMLAYAKCFGEGKEQYLMDLVRSYYEDDEQNDGLDKLIDPVLKGHIDMMSFQKFNDIAHECVNLSLKERPTMDKIIRKIEQALDLQNNYAPSTIPTRSLESFRITLEEITMATEGFKSDSCIGGGKFHAVYKAKLSERQQNHQVVINRLISQSQHDQFCNELKIISGFHHQNIIPFIGYCDEANEMIIVYEYAINGSLNDHLKDPNKRSCLTWAQRLKICVGAARGLEYLHTGLGEDNEVVHGNFKSENILLDENLEPKICDFRFSLQGYIKEQQIKQLQKPVDFEFYLNPIFEESIFHKEADVYSLGMILFEMLTGRLVTQLSSLGKGTPQYLGDLVIRNYNDRLDKLIDPFIKDQIDSRCYEAFTEIAYECISFYGFGGCPTMDTIIEVLEAAADFQGIKV